jgi:hypothetical protein
VSHDSLQDSVEEVRYLGHYLRSPRAVAVGIDAHKVWIRGVYV